VPLLIKDPELRQVCYRAYNEWLAEFCATAPKRLVGAGLIPIDDPGLRLTMEPSAYVRRQIWATFQTDYAGLRLLDRLGEHRVMWASDYPHADSTWPDSRKAIEDNFKGVPPAARRRILCDNARELYGL
jgi:predicted TIM-barrel fold metal-dependent hydrolase